MSSFNNKIHAVKNANYNTPPQNLPQFQNPFLLESKNASYNIWAKSMKEEKRNTEISNSMRSSQTGDDGSLDEEDLARHVMSEVYAEKGTRRDIKGFKKALSFSTDEIATYVGRNHVLLGLRGSSNFKDFVADAQIGVKSLIGLPDALANTLNNRYARDDEMFNKIRARYPNKKIIIGGHSLGNALGMNILKNHKEDKNISFYGYNGWEHESYNKDSRATNINKTGDLVSLFTRSDKTIGLTNKQKETLGGIVGGGVALGVGRNRLIQSAGATELRLTQNRGRQRFIQEMQERLGAEQRFKDSFVIDGTFAEDAEQSSAFMAEATPRTSEAIYDGWRKDQYMRLERNFPGSNNIKAILRRNNLKRLARNTDDFFITGGEDEVGRLSETLDPIQSQILASNTIIDNDTTEDELMSFLESNGFEVNHFDDYVNPVAEDIEATTATAVESGVATLAGTEIGLGLALSGLGLLGVGALGLYFALHSTNQFPLKHNKFKNKKSN